MAVRVPCAAVVDAREFAGEIVEIGLRETVGIPGEIEGPAAQPGAALRYSATVEVKPEIVIAVAEECLKAGASMVMR